MSTFSSQKSVTETETKGFSEADVNLFLKRGSALASRRAGAQSIGTVKPGEKTFTETTQKVTAGAGAEFFGASKDQRVESTSGFMGKFSTMSKEQIESLASTFKQREQNIAQRRAQPGRSSLFMGRA